MGRLLRAELDRDQHGLRQDAGPVGEGSAKVAEMKRDCLGMNDEEKQRRFRPSSWSMPIHLALMGRALKPTEAHQHSAVGHH